MMSAKMNVPELRFDEFREEWEKKKLGDLIKSLDAGVSVNSMGRMAKLDEKSILKTSCVSYEVFNIKENKVVLDNVEINRLKEPVTANSIIISRMNTPALVGANAFVRYDNFNTFLPDRLWAAKIKQNASPLWTSLLTSSPKIRALLSTRATGTSNSMKNITKGDVLTLPIVAPSKQEQEKIASFLSSVDTKIEQLTSKAKLLQEYKKGVMQKIFSQEIRFQDDDGNNYPEWIEKKLGEHLIHKSVKNKDNKVDLVLSVSNKKGFITQEEQFDGYEVASKDLTNYKIVHKDEYAYNPSRINVGSIARLKNFNNGIVSPMYSVFKLNEINPEFFDALYQTHWFKHLIKIGCSGSVRDSLNFNDMADFKVNIPSLQEQTKIANFLSSIDSKIEQAQNQLDSIQEFKKALLQQMFV